VLCWLQNTASFRTDNLSWLVLDEADRLLDLGFEAKLKAILEKFDTRSSSNENSNPGDAADAAGGPGSSNARRRQTVLLSATLHPGLSVLAGLSLQDPVGVGFKAQVVDGQLQLAAEGGGADGAKQQDGQQQDGQQAAAAGGQIAFELPQQLKQKYVDVDAKMRLVYLIGERRELSVFKDPFVLLSALHAGLLGLGWCCLSRRGRLALPQASAAACAHALLRSLCVSVCPALC
jgi:ATP-dependent RNA helicase DDX31/DBP7